MNKETVTLCHLESIRLKDARSRDISDVTSTLGYNEAMDDVKHGRVTEYASLKDFYKEMGL